MKNRPDWNKVLNAASGDVRRLDYVTRYSSIPVTLFESVSAHSYWVSIYSLLIHREMMPDDIKLVGPILTKSIIHDLAESITGDVVRTFKYSSKKLKEAIDEAEDKIINKFPEEIRALYTFYEGMIDDPEVCPIAVNPDYIYVEAVVKAADFLSLQQYMNREWLRGNREIEPFFERMIADLGATADKIEESKEPRVRQLAELYRDMAKSAKSSKTFTT